MNDLLFFDIEADGFLYEATTIWCLVAKLNGHYHIYLHGNEVYETPEGSSVYNNLPQFLQEVFKPETIRVGHNIITYDLPVLQKLVGYQYEINTETILDTHILSRLYNPDRLGHSLEWFGDKFGFPKGDHNDFTQLSQKMIDYCIRDVDLTEKVYEYLTLEGADWDWSEAIKLEDNTWHIQQKQELKGVLFDKKAAEILLGKIQTEITQLESEILAELPLFPKSAGELKKIFLKSGEYTQPVKEWYDEC